MNHVEVKRNQSINKVVNSIKILILVFSVIGFLKYMIKSPVGFCNTEGLFFIATSIVISVIYIIDLIEDRKSLFIIRNKTFQYLEILIFIFMFSKLIVNTGGVFSSYIIMLVILCIIITLQRDFIASIIVSVYSGVFILIISYKHYKEVSEVIFNDMLLAISFIAICLVLKILISEEKSAREKIIESSNIDCLTNVYNRKYFNALIRNKYDLSRESGDMLSVILLDVDYFKRVNDNYGHCFGDKVLRKVASIIKDIVSEKNIVARYGGEEFGIILSGYNVYDAKVIANKIRKTIEESNFLYEDTGESVKITASLGICVYPSMANSISDLIKKADEALYKAKNISRNRVEVYNSILEEIKIHVKEENTEFLVNLKSIMKNINSYDKYTLGHSERLVMYSEIFSDELGLKEESRNLLRYAAYLHDIGKVNINNTLKETSEYRDHVKKGVEIIKDIESLKQIKPVILYHHENYNGTGFPSGLKGDAIPPFAKIISIINKFDNITSYKNEKSHIDLKHGIESLRALKGSHLDPKLCESFIKAIEKNEKLFYSFSKNILDIY